MKSQIQIKSSLNQYDQQFVLKSNSYMNTNTPHFSPQKLSPQQFSHPLTNWDTSPNNYESQKIQQLLYVDSQNKMQHKNISLPKLNTTKNRDGQTNINKKSIIRYISQQQINMKVQNKVEVDRELIKMNLISVQFPNFNRNRKMKNKIYLNNIQQYVVELQNKRNKIKALQNLRNKQLQSNYLDTPYHHFKRFNNDIEQLSNKYNNTRGAVGRQRLNTKNIFMKQLLKAKQHSNKMSYEQH